ncbi:MAG: serine/threonine protein kinase [Deltaproteobacteria bacterium]|nr:serine/threonine protein kinase [Deltaproteobacteria bacterium]
MPTEEIDVETLRDSARRLADSGVRRLDESITLSHWQSEPPARSVTSTLPRLLLETSSGTAHPAALQVVEEVGRGGMGIVQLAAEPLLDREVALKRLHSDDHNADDIHWLLREARISGSLEHPNVVPVHALGRDDDELPVLVMKHVSGVTWRDLIDDAAHPKWPEGITERLHWHLEILMQVCNAVHFAHSRGIVHLDIKPSNVMIGDFGEVYLIDWGIAVRVGEAHPCAGDIVGTPRYMAPEMCRGLGDHITAKTDVYLLGATLHCVLTGAPRHNGAEMLDVLKQATASTPCAYGSAVPPELGALCNRSTSRALGDRPPSAVAFRNAIADYLEHRASNDVTDAGEASLDQLMSCCREATRDSADDELRAHYTECAFGFTQALRAWPDNERAAEGLQAARVLLIEHELKRGHAEAAAVLLKQLTFPRPDLGAELARLQAADADSATYLAHLQDLEHDVDPDVAVGPRTAIAIVVGCFILALSFGLAQVYPRGEGLTHPVLATAMFGLTVVTLLGAVLAPKELRTRANRVFWGPMVLGPAAGVVNHLVAAQMGAPVAPTLAFHLVWCGAMAVLLALAVARAAAWFALPLLAGALAIAFWPARVLELVGVAFFFGYVVALVIWRRSRTRRDGPRPPGQG